MKKRIVTSMAGLAMVLAAAPAQAVFIGSATIGYWDAADPGSNPSTTWEGLVNDYDFTNDGAVHNAGGQYYEFRDVARMDGTGDHNLYNFPTDTGDGAGAGEPRTIVWYGTNVVDPWSGRWMGKTDETGNGAEIQGWYLYFNNDGDGRFDFNGQAGGEHANQTRWYDRTGDHGTDNQLTFVAMASDGSGEPSGTQWYINGNPTAQSYSESNLNGTLVNDHPLVIGAINLSGGLESGPDSSNMDIQFIEILDEKVTDEWILNRWNGGSPLRGAAYLAPQTTASVTPGAEIDLRASALGKAKKEWFNDGTLGGAYPSLGVVQSSGEAAAFGNTRSIPWTSGWTGDGSDDSHHVWGDSKTDPNAAVPQLGVENFSLEMWLERKGDALGGEAQIAGLRSPNHATRFTFSLDSGANTLQIDDMRGVNNAAAPAGRPFNSGIELPLDGRFHHVVWTWDDTTKILSLYYDGGNTPDYTVDLSADADAPDYDPSDLAIWTSIGASHTPEGFRRFQGRVNTFRVYTSTLTGDEADANFLAGPDQFGVQNGVAGYDGYENTQINWGGWSYDTNLTPGDCTDDTAGSYPGFDVPGLGPWNGQDDIDFDNSAYQHCDGTAGGTPSGPRFSSRNLIAFRGLEDQVSPGFQVGKATVVYHLTFQRDDGNVGGPLPDGAPITLDAFEATAAWDSNTFWTSYCNGAMDPGCTGPMVGQILWDPPSRNDQLAASPGGTDRDNAYGCVYIPMDIDAALVQKWIDDPSSNNGLVLSLPLFSWTSAWTMGGEEVTGTGLGDPPRLILEPASDTVCIQDGVNGYDGYENTHINWGGWAYDRNLTNEDCTDDTVGSYPGFDTPGLGPWSTTNDDIDFDGGSFEHCDGSVAGTPSGPRFTAKNLIAFRGLENEVPAGFQVGTATIIYHLTFQRDDGSGIPTTLDAFEATAAWDSNTFWTSYCNGAMDPGCTGPIVGQIPWDAATRNAQLAASPGGTAGDNALGCVYIPMTIDASLVQKWIDTPSSNHGLLLSTPLGSQTSAFTIGGEEGTATGTGEPPQLLLTTSTAVPASGDFTTISISGGTTVNMDFTGGASTDYQLQSTTDPVGGTWGNQGTPQTTDGSGNTSFSAPVVGSGEAFRAEEQ